MSRDRWFRSRYAVLTRDVAEAVMRGHLSNAQARVWLAIFDHANRDTGEAWPSVETLCEVANLGERTVRRAVRDLAALGWIQVEERAGANGRQTTNLYRLREAPGGVPLAAGGGAASGTLGGAASGTQNQNQRNQNQRTNPPTPQGGDQVGLSSPQRGTRAEGSNPRARGTSPRAAKRALSAAAIEERLDAAWSSLSTFDRGQALEGHERLRDAVAELLAKPLPKRVTEAGLVLAWLERATTGTSLAGLRGPAGWLVKAARKRDPAADAKAYAERLEAGRRKRAGPAPEPEPDPADLEPVDLDLLRRVSDSTRTA